MIAFSDLKKGDLIQYKKEVMFKGLQEFTTKITAVTDKKIICENGEEFHLINQNNHV